MKTKGRILLHVVIKTKGGVPVFQDNIKDVVELAIIRSIGNMMCVIVEMKVMKTHLHVVVDLNETISPSMVVVALKKYISAAIGRDSETLWKREVFIQSVYPNGMQELIDYIKNNNDGRD